MPFLAAFDAGVLLTLTEAWAAMILIGNIHSEVPAIPAFNYWASLGLVVLVSMFLLPLVSGRDA